MLYIKINVNLYDFFYNKLINFHQTSKISHLKYLMTKIRHDACLSTLYKTCPPHTL